MFLSALILASLMMCVSGLESRLPSERIKKLLFPREKLMEALLPMIIEARQADKEYTDTLRQEKLMEIAGRYYMNLPQDYWKKIEEEKETYIDNTQLFLSKNKFKWMGNYLLSSSYPDEQGIMHALSKFKLKPLDLNIHLFSYGGAYIYPLAAVLEFGSLFKMYRLTPDKKYYMEHPAEVSKMFIVGKLFGIIAYMLSIFLIFIVCKKLYANDTVALMGAIFLAFNPGLIVTSHFLKPWVYSIFWVILCLYFASKINSDAKTSRKFYILGGISAGMAMGSTYPAGYIFLSLIFYYLYGENRVKNFKLLIYSFLALILTHFLANPYHLLAYKEFFAHYNYTSQTWFKKVDYFNLPTHLNNLVEITYAFGITFMIAIICGIILAFIKKRKEDLILLACTLGYYFGNYKIVSYRHNTAMHVTPLIPVLVVLGARFLGWLWERKNKKIFIVLFVIMLLDSLGNSLFYAYKIKKDPEIEAGQWINQNIPKGSSIGTYINIDGYRLGYPAYDYLGYKFINDADIKLSQISARHPQYYLAISLSYRNRIDKEDPFLHNIEVNSKYHKIKSFDSDVPFWSRIYRSDLIYFWVDKVEIYRRNL